MVEGSSAVRSAPLPFLHQIFGKELWQGPHAWCLRYFCHAWQNVAKPTGKSTLSGWTRQRLSLSRDNCHVCEPDQSFQFSQPSSPSDVFLCIVKVTLSHPAQPSRAFPCWTKLKRGLYVRAKLASPSSQASNLWTAWELLLKNDTNVAKLDLRY